MPEQPLKATDVARSLATRLDELGYEYAFGGAIALGYWAEPRGTIDVDLTLFIPHDKPSQCLWCLKELGCTFETSIAQESLSRDGFCRVQWHGVRLDVFLPIVPFYESAKTRRRQVRLSDTTITIWDAETLAVFKMMFFRRKDIADLEQILRTQADAFDREWVRQQLLDLFGKRDPRIIQWDELDQELSDNGSLDK